MTGNQPPIRGGLMPLVLAGLIAAGGVAMSVWSYQQAREVDLVRSQNEFNRRIEARQALTAEIVTNYEAGLFGLRNLFVASESVTRSEFSLVARDTLARYPGITALEWAPVTPRAQVPALERTASAELGVPFRVSERDPERRVTPAADRPSYTPILYVEPIQGNELTLGLDLLNNPGLDRDAARRDRRMVISGAVDLVQGRRGLIMVWPIFRRDSPGDALQGRFMGFIQAIFRIDELFNQTQLRQRTTAMDTLFVDNTATTPANRFLCYCPGENSGNPAATGESTFESGYIVSRTLAVGGREWKILYRPTQAWIASQETTHPLIVLWSGFAVTGLLGALMYTLGRRNVEVASLVSRRTAELSESRRQLDSLFRSLPGMAYRFRVEPGLRFTLTFVSEGSLPLTGYTPEEFVSGDVQIADRIHPEDLGRVRALTREALEAGRALEVEYRLRTRGGEEKWILSRGRGINDEEGKTTLFEGLAVDVTLGKRAEAEKLALERKLLESQKLESLGVLAGGIAHDFNNLLTTIMGNASLARLELDADSPQQKKLRQIEVTSVRAAELCQQMLAYSGKSRFVLERIDMGSLITDSLPLIQFSVAKSAEIRLELAAGLPPVLADATQLRQIIMNLVMNASEAIGDRMGEIGITTRLVDAAPVFLRTFAHGADLAPGRYVALSVRDTGSGMSPETVARIFDPFFSTKFTGRGLGLAAVLGIIRSHHGGLKVESAPGKGTVFEILLPPTEGVAVDVAGRTTAASSFRHAGNVLVVDDEDEVRDVSVDILKRLGFTVAPARNGTEALEIFGRDPGRFDLVLLDVTMPGPGGEEVLARIRALNAKVPVIMMSGHAEADLVAHLKEVATGFLSKPFAISTLVERIREALGIN